MLLNRANNVFGAFDVGADRFVRKIFAGGHLFQRRGIEDDVHAAKRLDHGMKISNVADAKFEALLKVSVDDFVRGRGLVLIFHSHRMLLGFIAREHDDLLRLAGAAFQETTYQSLPQGSGAARNQNSPSIKTMLLRIIPILHSWYHRLPNPLQAPATWDKSNRSLARICLLSCSDRRKNPRRE